MVKIQVLDEENEIKYVIKLEEIILIEELPIKKEEAEKPKVVESEKSLKKNLLRLLNKAKFNNNYFKDTKRIEDIRDRAYFRNFGVY